MNVTLPPRICLIEDDPIMGESLCDRFGLEGFDIDWHRSAAAAIQALHKTSYAVVISDIRLPDREGGDLFLAEQQRLCSVPPFIFITGFGSIDRAVALLRAGAADYLTKPFDLDLLVEKVRRLADEHPVRPESDTELGISPAMRRIQAMLPNLAAQACTVLITGESGVGKEVVARAFHRLTPAGAEAPFVALNCAAVPESLLEAELFGFEKGAFTGAHRTRKGVFEQADGGTLFLDEIGDMPLAMQAKLLRVLQGRYVTRLGGEQPVPVKLRLISATHQDLKALVHAGRFREDLFYRLDVIHLAVPPLRQRREDVLWLARLFLAELAPEKRLAEQAEQVMLSYDWPGNVRELRHAVERGAILSPGPVVGPAHLFGEDAEDGEGGGEGSDASLATYLTQAERRHISKVWEENGRHMGHTADALGISRKNLWEKMKKLGLSATDNEAA